MNTEEYFKKIREIKKEFDEKNRILDLKFVLSNSSHKVGDIISDSDGSIIIDAIDSEGFTCTKDGVVPGCVYIGICLTKKMTPRKDGKRRKIFQHRIIRGEL